MRRQDNRRSNPGGEFVRAAQVDGGSPAVARQSLSPVEPIRMLILAALNGESLLLGMWLWSCGSLGAQWNDLACDQSLGCYPSGSGGRIECREIEHCPVRVRPLLEAGV